MITAGAALSTLKQCIRGRGIDDTDRRRSWRCLGHLGNLFGRLLAGVGDRPPQLLDLMSELLDCLGGMGDPVESGLGQCVQQQSAGCNCNREHEQRSEARAARATASASARPARA
jgi:hypothetical protein